MSLHLDPEAHQALIEDGGNISKTSPLKMLLQLMAGLILAIVIMVMVLVSLSELVVSILPDSAVRRIHHLARALPLEEVLPASSEKLQTYLETLLSELISKSDLKDEDYEIRVVSSKEINAYAMLGNRILLTKGLLSKVESRNELAMILGHELGHFHSRDILKGFSTQAISILAFGFLMPADGVGDLIQQGAQMGMLQFSRNQESRADQFALKALTRVFPGNSSGVTDFFTRDKDDLSGLAFLKFLSTHPGNEERVRNLEASMKMMELIQLGETRLPEWWDSEIEKIGSGSEL